MTDDLKTTKPGRELVLDQLTKLQPIVASRHAETYKRQGYTIQIQTGYDIEPPRKGQRFVKLLKGGAVFCFVELESGDIYKAAGYSAPAKGVRGNIFSAADVERTMSNPNGGGFYVR